MSVRRFSVRDTVERALCHRSRRAFQALLGVDHIAAGRTLLATSVPARPNQFRRRTHRRHYPVEQVSFVTVTMDGYGKVASREYRLLVRDRVRRERRPGKDPLAVATRDLMMPGEPLSLQPLPRHTRRYRSDLVLRLEIYALGLQRAMIDPRIEIECANSVLTCLP